MKSIAGLSSQLLLGLIYSSLQYLSVSSTRYGGGEGSNQQVYSVRRVDSPSQYASNQHQGSPEQYPYGDSYRHYNIHCWRCWSEDLKDDCATGNIDNNKVFDAEKCEDADVNLCYVFKNSKIRPNGEIIQEVGRGCAKNSGNPCNAGIKYESCSYQVCQHDLCNTSNLPVFCHFVTLSAIISLGLLFRHLLRL